MAGLNLGLLCIWKSDAGPFSENYTKFYFGEIFGDLFRVSHSGGGGGGHKAPPPTEKQTPLPNLKVKPPSRK